MDEPLEFLLDCAEDDLARQETLIGDLIYQLYHAQRTKKRLEHSIAALKFDIEAKK